MKPFLAGSGTVLGLCGVIVGFCLLEAVSFVGLIVILCFMVVAGLVMLAIWVTVASAKHLCKAVCS